MQCKALKDLKGAEETQRELKIPKGNWRNPNGGKGF